MITHGIMCSFLVLKEAISTITIDGRVSNANYYAQVIMSQSLTGQEAIGPACPKSMISMERSAVNT